FLFDAPAFKNVIVNELILDGDGQKMSKSKGNAVDPFDILDRFGADTTRWYLVATSPPWRSTLFNEAGLVEVQRKFLGTLLNTYAFFCLYANIDRFEYRETTVPVEERQEIDRWILSALNSLVKLYEEAMDEYDVTKAARAVSDFTIDQLSNWYVRRNRRRFWKNEMGKDKLAAYQTLFECLVTITKLMAPFAPFMADELYRNLSVPTGREKSPSVHLAMIPDIDTRAIDRELESRMEKAERIVTLVRAMRNKSNLKVRQPLSKVIVPVSSPKDRAAIASMRDVILDEINVKDMEFVQDDSGIVHKSIKPNFKILGPKYGKNVQPIAAAIRKFGSPEINVLEKEGKITVSLNGENIDVLREDADILHEDIKGWVVESDGTMTVALDTELTPALVNEGLAREFVNRVQNMRKDAGFDVTDRIKLHYTSDKKLSAALEAQSEYVRNETLATEFREGSGGQGFSADWEINGEHCSITIQRLSGNGV
ncbi:MAG TPA: DUF5915 domain-containing protein, partial [Bacteroidota bacterium]|nr:DUF5915 domain-containing protein [Bacteroidota bacterium]